MEWDAHATLCRGFGGQRSRRSRRLIYLCFLIVRIDSRSGVGFCVKYAGSIVDLQKIRQTRYSEACMDPGFFFPEGVRGIFMFAGVVYGVCVCGGGWSQAYFSNFIL